MSMNVRQSGAFAEFICKEERVRQRWNEQYQTHLAEHEKQQAAYQAKLALAAQQAMEPVPPTSVHDRTHASASNTFARTAPYPIALTTASWQTPHTNGIADLNVTGTSTLGASITTNNNNTAAATSAAAAASRAARSAARTALLLSAPPPSVVRQDPAAVCHSLGFRVHVASGDRSASVSANTGASDVVVVQIVDDRSSAAFAGLRKNDVIRAVNHRPVSTIHDFNELLSTAPAHGLLLIEVARLGYSRVKVNINR